MKWFGEDWGAPVCRDTERVPAPVGQPCSTCGNEIERKDQGLILPFAGPRAKWAIFHLVCFLRTIGFGYTRADLKSGTNRVHGQADENTSSNDIN